MKNTCSMCSMCSLCLWGIIIKSIVWCTVEQLRLINEKNGNSEYFHNRQFSKQALVKETGSLLIIIIAHLHCRIIRSWKYISFTQKCSDNLFIEATPKMKLLIRVKISKWLYNQFLLCNHAGNFPTSTIWFQPVNLSSCVRLIIRLYTFQPVKLASCRISCQVANLATCAFNAFDISLGKFPNAVW